MTKSMLGSILIYLCICFPAWGLTITDLNFETNYLSGWTAIAHDNGAAAEAISGTADDWAFWTNGYPLLNGFSQVNIYNASTFGNRAEAQPAAFSRTLDSAGTGFPGLDGFDWGDIFMNATRLADNAASPVRESTGMLLLGISLLGIAGIGRLQLEKSR